MTKKQDPEKRLERALKRKGGIKPIEEGDIFYAWAAYKAGLFRDVFKADLDAVQFKDAFRELIASRYDAAWLLSAKTAKRGLFPVGMALGFWPHRIARPFMVLDALIWFPWASPRNKVEAAVNFADKARNEIPMLAFARDRDRAFMEMLARCKVIRRIGTSRTVFTDGQASVWETNKD